jgi:HEPN domain-containing protein
MNNELDVNDWISSAQEDMDMILLGSKVPIIASTCYHCGQAVEKILKAYLIAKESKLTKTHDLDVLVAKCEKHSPDFNQYKKIGVDVSAFSTIRYPPKRNITEQEMKETIESAYKIIDFTMSKLNGLGYKKQSQPQSEAIKKMIKAVSSMRK